MISVQRSALLPYNAADVFQIVNDVARYPEFLPWCSAADVIEQSRSEIVASLSLRSKGVSETFTTRNLLTPFDKIEMELVSGPFRHFSGGWTFTRLGEDDGCRVSLNLEYQFTGMKALLGTLFTSAFTNAADQMVDAFCHRANSQLGQLMHVEVVYALRTRQHSVHLELADSATVASALTAIDRIAPFKDLDLDAAEVGVFGRLVSREQVLRPGDRVEIYRPLTVDPKEARRRRATRLQDSP